MVFKPCLVSQTFVNSDRFYRAWGAIIVLGRELCHACNSFLNVILDGEGNYWIIYIAYICFGN